MKKIAFFTIMIIIWGIFLGCQKENASKSPVNLNASAYVFGSGPGEIYNKPLSEVCLINKGTYWKVNDDKSYSSRSWMTGYFNDELWKVRKSGFKNDLSVSRPFSNQRNNTRIVYLRKSFNLGEHPFKYHSLKLGIPKGEHAIVYINGIEVYRNDSSKKTSGLLHVSEEKNDKTSYFTEVIIRPDFLRSGTNLIAVEVQQCFEQNSEFNFDLILSGLIKKEI